MRVCVPAAAAAGHVLRTAHMHVCKRMHAHALCPLHVAASSIMHSLVTHVTHTSRIRHTNHTHTLRAQIELDAAMSSILPANLTRYFYCNSGSEAVENAVKIARAATGRQDIIAFDVRSSRECCVCGGGGGGRGKE